MHRVRTRRACRNVHSVQLLDVDDQEVLPVVVEETVTTVVVVLTPLDRVRAVPAADKVAPVDKVLQAAAAQVVVEDSKAAVVAPAGVEALVVQVDVEVPVAAVVRLVDVSRREQSGKSSTIWRRQLLAKPECLRATAKQCALHAVPR